MQMTQRFILCSNLRVSGVQISLNCVWRIIKRWMTNNMLQLNANKTEVIYFHSNRTMPPSLPIKIGDSLMKPDISVKNLFLDTSLSMHTHVTHLCKLTYFHLFNISSIHRYITKDVTNMLVHSLVFSRLDYANSLLFHIPEKLFSKLQRVQNVSARIITHI